VTESFALPLVGAWRTATIVHLVQRNGIWKVAWTPATVNPPLHGTERLAAIKDWPARAGITGADGASLLAAQQRVNVGLVGSRIKNAGEVSADLVAAGAAPAQVKAALAQAKAGGAQRVLRARDPVRADHHAQRDHATAGRASRRHRRPHHR
jgi:hypothetical protein